MNISPTKSNLRKAKNDLTFAYEGFDLLDQKREILVMEIMKNVSMIKEIESQLAQNLQDFYLNYKTTAIEMGSESLNQKSSSEKELFSLTIKSIRFMGIEIPEIKLSQSLIEKNSSFFGTTASYDLIKEKGKSIMKLLVDYATITKSIFTLSMELKKVQRKVNALEKIFIPQNEEIKKYISERLEEMEREEIFVKKLIKQRNE